MFMTSASVFAVSPESAISLDEGSEFLVHLSDPELLENGKKTWQILEDSWMRRCELSVQSHYDRGQAIAAGDVVYHFHQFHSHNDLSYYNQNVRDQFNVWLTTDNKDLPLLNFECFQEVPLTSQAPKKFTFAYVAEFIGQPNFFLHPVAQYEYVTTPFDLMPIADSILIGEDLHFKAVETSGGSLSGIEHPRLRDGKLLGKDERAVAQCSVNYSPAKFGPYDITLKKGEKWPLTYFQQAYGHYYSFAADMFSARLSVSCFFDAPIEDFSEIRKALGSVIQVQ
jgi:hypothetical protein